MTLLMDLYYLYKRSPKQKKALQRSFAVLEMKSILPTRIGGTRWLPHLQRALDAFLKGYRAICCQLQTSSHENAKAEGLAKLATDGHIIVFILKLKVIVGVLMKLSLYLQKKELSLADAFTRVRATVTLLQDMNTRENAEVSEVLDSGMFLTTSVTFKGRKPHPFSETLVNSVTEALQSRFPDTQNPVIDATAISGLNNWPHPGSDNILEYGTEEVKTLHSHFKEILPAKEEELLEEWSILKLLVYKKYSSRLQAGDISWEDIFMGMRDHDIPRILGLIELLRSLPPTSVRNEATFSAMKLVKSKRRGKMGPARLNDLLLIHLEAPSIHEFDPEQAINEWMITPSGRSRRVGYSRKTAPTTSSENVPEEETIQIDDDLQYTEKNVDDQENDDVEEEDDDDIDTEMTEDLVYSMLLTYARE